MVICLDVKIEWIILIAYVFGNCTCIHGESYYSVGGFDPCVEIEVVALILVWK